MRSSLGWISAPGVRPNEITFHGKTGRLRLAIRKSILHTLPIAYSHSSVYCQAIYTKVRLKMLCVEWGSKAIQEATSGSLLFSGTLYSEPVYLFD